MKRKVFLVLALFIGTGSFIQNTEAQTVSDIQNLTLSPNTYWNGSDLSGGFNSGAAKFVNVYDATYFSWSGFAYSDMQDTTTAAWSNQYSCIKGKGVLGSSNYAVGYVYPESKVIVNNQTSKAYAKGFYVTNSTYAYLSMLNGDAYSKKFGGVSGNDTDWFKLTIIGYHYPYSPDTTQFYLADYRFANNSMDYIIKDWTWVDLTGFGAVDSMGFILSSTDNGTWGMNTPAYFCVDNLTLDYVPYVANPLPNVNFNSGQLEQTLSFTNTFNDIDAPSLTLNYAVAKVSDTNKIHASITGYNLLIKNAVPIPVKTAINYHEFVVLSAESNGLYAYDTIYVDANIQTSIHEFSTNDLVTLFPNPATNFIAVKSNLKFEEYSLLNATGYIIKEGKWSSTDIDLSLFPSGLYFLKLKTNQAIFVKHFIKK